MHVRSLEVSFEDITFVKGGSAGRQCNGNDMTELDQANLSFSFAVTP